ncbi:amidohydrolase family protein [Erythrobacter aureus]|uniref:Amidohydrolase n=1 Tax=Erythrobacter aureus TaxID=2182384 RepID=A0A345YB08_9SPHN|nr:amidohydrolase family protein [Erythrobacter aureus]AXK41110.1 amidohydrolase [Erythrobacter aureus]
MPLDTHQHFWALANPFTDWPTQDLTAIHRDFGPDDLRPLLDRSGIDETILVQAAPSIAETEYCLAIATDCDFVKGVVGWVDFEAEDAVAQIDRLARSPLLKGLRPMVQAIEEPGWLLRDEFEAVFVAMIRHGLRFDALVLAHQIPALAVLASRYPDLSIVLDHGGKPPIAGGESKEWEATISALARNANVHCKLSGLWTEAGTDISIDAIRPWVRHLLDRFGPTRLMWGSDWPVLELAGSYGGWLAQCETLLEHLDDLERAAIFGGNGRQFYGID